MPEKQSRGKVNLESRALKILAKRYKLKHPLLVNQLKDQLKSRKKIYLFQASSTENANGPQYSVVLDAKGNEVDIEKARKAEDREFFAISSLTVDLAAIKPLAATQPITIDPTINDLVLKEGEIFNETITVTVPANKGPDKVDVYFLADTTGSMSSILNAVETGASNILTALGAMGSDFAYGVGNYKDFPNDPYAFQHQQNLTNVVASVQTAINNWSPAAGGGDTPEGQIYALEKIAQPPGGSIGWRNGAKRIIVWFGDAPGHDPICTAISGEPAIIDEGTATAKLVAENITVLAISTATPGLDKDPVPDSADYGVCGAPGGAAGQGTRLAAATGGQFVSGINPANIVQTIINLVSAAVGQITNLNLVPTGASAPLVTSISPAAGYGPLAGDKEHQLKFKVIFTGSKCKDADQVFTGTIDVVADGEVVAKKRVKILVPACPRYSYSVKFLCGIALDCDCSCGPVRPGVYATEINIYNYQTKEVEIDKLFIPVVLGGAAAGREPGFATPKAKDRIKLPPRSATMDDCCRIGEMLYGAVPAQPSALTIGFLQIISPVELAVTAVYTVSNTETGHISIDVEQIEARRPLPKPAVREFEPRLKPGSTFLPRAANAGGNHES